MRAILKPLLPSDPAPELAWFIVLGNIKCKGEVMEGVSNNENAPGGIV